MDSRRLVRALGLGALVFLVIGGGVGLAAADGAVTGTPVLASPGPADRASYDVEEIVLDRGEADLDLALPDTTLDVEWLDARDAVAADDTLRTAHPLATSFHLRWRGGSADYDAESLFDAGTGVPIGRAYAWSATRDQPTIDLIVTQPEAEAVDSGVSTALRGALAPCGFRSTLQGRPIVVGEVVTVYGGCSLDLQESPQEHRYSVKEWTEIRGRTVALLESNDEGLRLYYDPSLPVPVRLEAGMPESMDPHFRVGRMFRLDLRTFHAGPSDYPYALPVPVGEPVVSPREPRTPWMLQDAGIVHPFPLSEAYRIAFDPASYSPPNDDQTMVAEWVDRHPGAYLAVAMHASGRDATGLEHRTWQLIWADGDGDVLGKQVTRSTAGFLPLLPSGQGRTEVSPMPVPEEFEDFFPPARYLPARVPDLASAWERATPIVQARTGNVPDGYGFIAGCWDRECGRVEVEVLVGASGLPLGPVQAVQSQTSAVAMFTVVSDGAAGRLILARTDQRAPVPVLPPQEDPPAQPAEAVPTTAAVAWSLPSASAATGLGFLAVLASAAYYFWPAVKGGALGLFSRIEPDRVLDHPARKWLLALIEANPGIHFQEIVRRTGFGRGQLEHHLRKLEGAELVSRVKGDSYACFFARGQVDRRVMAAAPLLRSDGGRSILNALQQRPGASSRQLATQLGLAAGTVSYHVKRLREAGMLESAGGALHLTETGRQATGLAAA